MKLKEFSYSDITLKYVYQLPRVQSKNKKMLVVLSNCLDSDGHVDFLLSLSKFKAVPKLFLAVARDYKFGYYLIKDNTYILREAVEALIETYRVENEVEKQMVYLIGFCAASYSAVNIAINQGYNAIFTEYSFEGWRSVRMLFDKDEPRKTELFAKQNARLQNEFMDCTFSEWRKSVNKYTGRVDSYKVMPEFFEYVLYNYSEKFFIPKFYFYAGYNEEYWRLTGKETCLKLREYGINLELTIDDADFDHTSAMPFFITYLSGLLERLGVS